MLEVDKNAYKQSEIGLIPEDWDVSHLGDKTTKIGSGITPTGGERVYKRTGRPFIRSQNIGDGILLLEDVAYIDDETHNSFRATEIIVGDVFLNITGASIGRSAVADARVQKGNVNQHVCIIRTNHHELDPHFLKYFLLSNPGQQQVNSFQAGGNRQGLNFDQIRSFQIPIPPIQEQQVIAKVLRDTDSLIRALEQLITKKYNLRQAVLQKLLMEKKRLAGFKGEWKTERLGENSTLKARIGWQGLTTLEYKETGNFYLVTGIDFVKGKIDWQNCHYVDQQRYSQDPNIQLKPEDVLITKDGTIGKVAFIERIKKPATLNSGVFVVRPKSKSYEPKFLYYILSSRYFKQFLNRLSAGSTISHLYQKDFVHFEFPLPPTKEEQSAIAQVLSDMEIEIIELERMKDKYVKIRKGTMQQLLTGRIRIR